MAVYANENSLIPNYEFFLPILIPSKNTYNSFTENENWRPYLFFNSKAEAKKSQIRYYISRFNNSDVRIVKLLKGGKTQVKGGKVIFVSLNNIDGIDFHSQKQDSKKLTKSVSLFLHSVFLPLAFSNTSNTGIFGFEARIKGKKAGTGCFTQGAKTEAEFCWTCDRHPVLNDVAGNAEFLSNMARFLNQSSEKAKKKIQSAVPQSKEGGFTKICMSNNPLNHLIKTFNAPNSKCPIKFDEFYPSAYCESCKRSIPPEIMLGLMSIESSAKCQAEANTELENSLGLFQINSRVHDCTDRSGVTHDADTEGARNCLRNPINNLIESVTKLAGNYASVNPKPRSRGQCQSWSDFDDEEKDRWRKAVSAYNSGAGWLVRSIKSVKIAYSSLAKDGDYYTEMTGSHKQKKFLPAQEKYIKQEKLDPSWEDMRVYFFTEKLMQNPSLQLSEREVKAMKEVRREDPLSGRQLVMSLSNVAYVESILGRNEDRSYPGMVDIWEQHIKNNNKPSCNKQSDNS